MPNLGAAEKTQVMDVTVKADRKPLPPPHSPETVRAPRPVVPPPPAPPVAKAPPAPPATVAAPAPAPEAVPARSALPTGLILGGAGLVFLLAAGVAAIAVWRHLQAGPSPLPQPTVAPSAGPTPVAGPTPEPSAAVPLGVLRVETEPPGASVTLNGEARGVTPLDIADLPLGSYEVKLELKGYETKTQVEELTAEAAAREVKLTLARSSPTMAVADILSSPFGAAVSVDGKPAGATPITEFRLRPGTHRFELSKEGYEPYSETLKVEPGKRARIDAQLRAIPRATPAPTPPPDFVDTSKVYANAASEVDSLAKKVSGKAISYPENAPRLKSGDSVSITVRFVVNESGDVTDLQIVESGGSKALDEAVMGAVRTWKYTPAVKKNVKVKATITFKQTFRAG
jgi:TonB family protein